MVVCKYFLRGDCRFGDKCWNEHPFYDPLYTDFDDHLSYNKGRYNGPDNRYTWQSPEYKKSSGVKFSFNKALAETLSPAHSPEREIHGNVFSSSTDNSDFDLMKQDVLAWENGHIWPFSCFSPSKNGECYPGFQDISPEELRWEAYQAEVSGTFLDLVQQVKKGINEIKKKRELLKIPTPDVLQTLKRIISGKPIQEVQERNLSFGQSAFALPTRQPQSAFRFTLPQLHKDSNASATVFSGQPKDVDMFGLTEMSQSISSNTLPLGTGSSNVFGQAQPMSQDHPPDTSRGAQMYSLMESLQPEEKEQFMCQTFTLGKIPTCPPPRELCFS